MSRILHNRFPIEGPPPPGWDPDAAWVVERLLRPYRHWAPFYYLRSWLWPTHWEARPGFFAWPYIAAWMIIEGGALSATRFYDWHGVSTVVAIALVILRYGELTRSYAELLLEWEHDLRYRMERNLLLLLANFGEFTLLGATAFYVTNRSQGVGRSWFDAFATLTFYDLPRSGGPLHHLVAVALAVAAFVLVACGLAVILTGVSSKFEKDR